MKKIALAALTAAALFAFASCGKKVMICKFCKAHLKNKARLEKPAAAPAAAEAPAEAAAEAAPAEA